MNITVKELIDGGIVLAGSGGLEREVRSPQIARPDLSRPGRFGEKGGVVHLAPAQAAYLAGLPARDRKRLVRAILRTMPAAIVVSGGVVSKELLEAAESASVAVFKCRDIPRLSRKLAGHITPRIGMHGVLVQIFGVGTLITGESAIGKSEAALDLVLRGHKLVADDVVMLEHKNGVISGTPTDIGADLLEIRGLGVINVRMLYGDAATTAACDVGLVVELEEWREGAYYSLLGLRERRRRILDINLPYLKLPVKPGRNMATLIEVAARNQMLKERGIYAARELSRKLKKRLTR